MIVVTGYGGTPSDRAQYQAIVSAQARKCMEFGYRHIATDLDLIGVPASDFAPRVNGDSLPAATFKAGLVLEALSIAEQNELVCWMDADCLPIHDFTIPGIYGGFDAAVTLRPAAEIGLSNNPALDYLNSGVVFIRNTRGGKEFCRRWQALSDMLGTDQGALNEIASGGWSLVEPWLATARCIKTDGYATINAAGISVLMLSCEEWNSWHLPPGPTTRILHFKRGIRHAAKDYIGQL